MLLDTVNKNDNLITITVTDNNALSTTDKLQSTDISVTNGSHSDFTTVVPDTDPKSDTFTINVMPNYGATSVTVTVAANAVSDTANPANKNEVVNKTFDVAPAYHSSRGAVRYYSPTSSPQRDSLV